MLGAILTSEGGALALALIALAGLGMPSPAQPATRGYWSVVGGAFAGAGYAVVLFAGVHVLGWHLIAFPTDATRIALWGFYALVSLPFFAVVEAVMARATGSRIAHAGALLAAAISLAFAAPVLAARMGVVPVYLLAAAVVLLALSVAGGVSSTWGVAGRAILAAVVLGRAIAVTCPLF